METVGVPAVSNPDRSCDQIVFADTAAMGPKKRKVEEEEVGQEETVGTLHDMFPKAPLNVIKVNGVEGVVCPF